MKIKNVLPQLMAILGVIVLMASCEEDFDTFNSDILGDQNIQANLDDTRTVIAYSQKTSPAASSSFRGGTPLSTRGLPIQQLGVYNDPVYGKSTINLLSQVRLNRLNPTYQNGVVLDSVRLYIPYFSTEEVDAEGNITYTLDSIYGSGNPMTISMFRSNFFLRNFEPGNLTDRQNYYVDQGPEFTNFQGELVHTIEDFVPSSAGYVDIEIEEETGDTTRTNIAPGIRVDLSKDYFFNLILAQEGNPAFENDNDFNNYLRGFYFKVAGNGDNLLKVNMDEAAITLYYSEQEDEVEFGEPLSEDRTNNTIALNFDAIKVNVFENDLTPSIAADLEVQNATTGEERLYVRGGDGIVSIINLFGEDFDGNGVADELDDIRQRGWLINEANLKFYVDQTAVTGGAKEPERLMLYDTKNNRVLIDYELDPTAGDTPNDAITTHLGRLQRNSDGNGEFYKIRITNYVSDLIHRDSTNVALSLIVTQNVNIPRFNELETQISGGVDAVPEGSVIAHEGTVLYGNAAANESKRLKLEIFYTEPN